MFSNLNPIFRPHPFWFSYIKAMKAATATGAPIRRTQPFPPALPASLAVMGTNSPVMVGCAGVAAVMEPRLATMPEPSTVGSGARLLSVAGATGICGASVSGPSSDDAVGLAAGHDVVVTVSVLTTCTICAYDAGQLICCTRHDVRA